MARIAKVASKKSHDFNQILVKINDRIYKQ